MKQQKKHALIFHYRIGETDGVSLEIEKRRQVMEEMGWKVSLISGKASSQADASISSLDFDLPAIRRITKNAFDGIVDYPDESPLMEEINQLAAAVQADLEELSRRMKPDLILLHNIFSHGRHIPAAKGFYEYLKKSKLPCIATHHDFFWERENFRHSSCRSIDDYLNRYLPPRDLQHLCHAVINSLAQRAIKERCNINAMIIPDTINFSMPSWKADSFNSRILEECGIQMSDIVVLQATRIVPRKSIELMIPVLEALNSEQVLEKLRSRRLYNGKQTDSKSRVFLLLAGYPEQEARGYRDHLEEELQERRIPHSFFFHKIRRERQRVAGERFYSLFDTYPHADLISYPSTYEGWGNQFLEAVFAKRPVVAFEYPVFVSDIKSEGYYYISLGNRTMPSSRHRDLLRIPEQQCKMAVNEIVSCLCSSTTAQKLDRNYQIARKSNSFISLRNCMEECIRHAQA